MSQPLLSVVIPAFNEERRIASTLEQLHAYLSRQSYSWEILVSDDGSDDATAQLVSDFARRFPGIRLLSVEHRGKGWAVNQGMLAARGEYWFLCDADLAMPVEHLIRFLAPEMEKVDILVGSRELPTSRRFGEPASRHLMGRAFNLLIRRLTLPGIRDTQCGFKRFRAETARGLFERQQLWGFAFDVELLYLAQQSGLVIREVPIDWYHQPGSKVRPLRDALLMARDVMRIKWRLRNVK